MTSQQQEEPFSPPPPSGEEDGARADPPHVPEDQSFSGPGDGISRGADPMDLDDNHSARGEDGTRINPPEPEPRVVPDAPLLQSDAARQNLSAHVKLYGPGTLKEDGPPPPPLPKKEWPVSYPAHGPSGSDEAGHDFGEHGNHHMRPPAPTSTYGSGVLSTAKDTITEYFPWSGKRPRLTPAEEAKNRLCAISDVAAWEREKGWILEEIMQRYRAESDLVEQQKETKSLQKKYDAVKQKTPSYSYKRLEEQYRQMDAALRGSIAELQQANVSLHRDKEEALRLARAEFRRREKELDDRIKELEDIDAEQGRKVELAHSAAKAIMDETKSFASSDDDVKTFFSRQAQGWYDWAKEFAHKDPRCISALSPSDKHELYAEISPFVVFEDGKLPREIGGGKKANYMILQAMLANFICKEAFESPFWVLDAMRPPVVGSAAEGATARDEVTNLYCELMRANDRDAHQWRSIMMRIMAVSGMGEARKGESEHGRLHGSARRRHSERLTKRFLEGPAGLLLDEDAARNSNCTKRLREGIDKMLQYSAGLWSHRSFIKRLDLENFQTREQGCYKSRMQEAEVYQANKLDRPSACEGAPIVMVVMPAIIACGTEEGQNYATVWRPWMKAQLLVRLDDY